MGASSCRWTPLRQPQRGILPASSTGGENFQWRRIEGFNTFNAGTQITKGTSTDPVFEYDHNAGSSITGGYVYRGQEHPRMEGIYFFGDYNSGRVWGLQQDPSGNWIDRQLLETSSQLCLEVWYTQELGDRAQLEGNLSFLLCCRVYGPPSL